MHIIGPHTSIAGGLQKAAEQAAALSANGFGMFTKNQRQWRAKAITAEEASRFKETLSALGFTAHQILVHDSYLINLANADDEKWERALAAFVDEIERVETLGLQLLNFHPGSHLGVLDTQTACRRVATALDRAIEASEYAKLVIENTSGSGSTLGSTFEELAMIVEASRHSERIGCCIDTCHAHTAGYDLSTIEGFETAMDRFAALVGMDKLWGMHLNDAKSHAGSRLDRHASLGAGTIGWETFDHIAGDERFASIPLVLETVDESLWEAEVARLRWGKTMNALFERCRLFGHRGNSQQYLENTLDAFEACIQDGIDGIELDVQRTRCGTLVVFHDFTLSRLAGVDRRICEMEWEELKEIPIGGDQRIPTLEQVFALIGNRLLYDIELKAEGIGRTGLEEGVFKAIEDAGLQGNVLVSSFNPILLRRFKRRARNTIPTAVIYSRSKEVPTFLHEGQGRFLSRPTLLKPEREQALPMIERGKAVVVWTVDDEAEAQLLVAKGAKGIISNCPAALAHLFRG